MTIGDFFVKAVLAVVLVTMLNWFRNATWRARLWAMWLWALVMGLGWWWIYFYH
jgi:hypothetical protein